MRKGLFTVAAAEKMMVISNNRINGGTALGRTVQQNHNSSAGAALSFKKGTKENPFLYLSFSG